MEPSSGVCGASQLGGTVDETQSSIFYLLFLFTTIVKFCNSNTIFPPDLPQMPPHLKLPYTLSNPVPSSSMTTSKVLHTQLFHIKIN